jgi:drug/metabolite transporter (DMT)-like permease
VLVIAVASGARLGSRHPSITSSSAAGALVALANLAFLLAVHHGELTIVAVISALYPAGTVLLARAILDERLTSRQTAGLMIGAIAVALLATG